MKIKLPERLAGTKDALFVLEVEFPVATEERTVEVVTSGAIEALDLRGTGPGGVYKVPVGFEQLHVPMRVKEDADGEATVTVNLTDGPDAPVTEERTLLLEKGPTGAAATGAGSKLAVGGVLLAALAAAAIWIGPKLLGGAEVPEVAGLTESAAMEKLQAAEYVVEVVTEEVAAADQNGVVLRTVPAQGAGLKKGEKVQLVIGVAQEQLVKVDSVVGQTEDGALTALRAAGFQVHVYDVEAQPGEEPDRVLRQSPDRGAFVDRGTEIELWVARAASIVPTPPDQPPTPPDQPPTPPDQPPTPPDQPPTPPDQPPTPPDQPPTPPDQPPTPPDQPPTPPVNDGMVGVPQFVGKTFADAERQLEALGLFAIPEYESVAQADQADRVLRQLPSASERISPGTQVFLTIGQYTAPTPPTPPDQPPTPPDQPPTPPDQPPTPPDQPPTPPDQPPTPPDQPPTPPDQPPTPPDRPPTPPDRPPTPPDQPPTPPDRPPTPPVAPRDGSVPDLIGLSRSRAEGIVRGAGFHFRILLEETADVPDGQVLSQMPGPGKALEQGATVEITVARAPALQGVVVPNVVGKARAEAETLLRAESFLVRATYGGGGGAEAGRVTDQEPRGGSNAARRTWVEIVVAGGSGPRAFPSGGPPPALPGSSGGAPPAPRGSQDLTKPPAVGEGGVVLPPPTPSGARPVPPVRLPGRDAPTTLQAPDVVGQSVGDAIAGALRAGLIPIIELDRVSAAPPGQVMRQSPGARAGVRPGDLVRLGVHVQGTGERYVDLPTALGGLLVRERRVLQATGVQVEVIEIESPDHPYAGTGRVAAQYPVSSVPRSLARRVTLWIVK